MQHFEMFFSIGILHFGHPVEPEEGLLRVLRRLCVVVLASWHFELIGTLVSGKCLLFLFVTMYYVYVAMSLKHVIHAPSLGSWDARGRRSGLSNYFGTTNCTVLELSRY